MASKGKSRTGEGRAPSKSNRAAKNRATKATARRAASDIDEGNRAAEEARTATDRDNATIAGRREQTAAVNQKAAPPAPQRLLVGSRPEFATDGMGEPHKSKDVSTVDVEKQGFRFSPLVGPPEHSLPSAAIDAATRAAVAGEMDAAFATLPAGTILESLGPVHGWRVRAPGMHAILGNGMTPLEAIQNLGVTEKRDEELTDAERTARDARKRALSQGKATGGASTKVNAETAGRLETNPEPDPKVVADRAAAATEGKRGTAEDPKAAAAKTEETPA